MNEPSQQCSPVTDGQAESAVYDLDQGKGDILRCIMNNMLFDASLQSMGYGYLCYMFQKYPDLNDPALYIKIDTEELAKNYHDYAIGTETIAVCGITEAISRYEHIVEELYHVYNHIILQLGGMAGRIVGGSLRAYVELVDSEMNITLVWLYKNKTKKEV